MRLDRQGRGMSFGVLVLGLAMGVHAGEGAGQTPAVDRPPVPIAIAPIPAGQVAPVSSNLEARGASEKPAPVTTGTVVGVLSGDIIRVRVATNNEVKVRLAGVAAPVKGQAYAEQSKSNLYARLIDQTLVLTTVELTRRGMPMVVARLKGESVNEAVIASGDAWYLPRSYRAPELAKAQQRAARDKAGLWAQEKPVPPWSYGRVMTNLAVGPLSAPLKEALPK